MLLKSWNKNIVQFNTPCVHNFQLICKSLDVFQEPFLELCFVLLLRFFSAAHFFTG